MTTMNMNLKTTLALPTLPGLAPRRAQTRFVRPPRPAVPRGAKFTAEDAIFAVTMLVFAASVVACFFWIWN
jgi:hypothetical protein